MLEQSFQPLSNRPNLTEAELQAWAERILQRPRAFQELPLILVPPYFQLSDTTLPLRPLVQTATQNWIEAAHLEDERLRIERRLIPHTPILIPDTAKGRRFFKLAKAIADIPLNAAVIPKNQHQGYWFKTLHYFWQARGVVIAQQLLGVIPEPLGESGVLRDRLAEKNLEFLHLSKGIDIACLQLLVHGGHRIRHWARMNKIPYPFKSPQELLLEILKEKFLLMWQIGPQNPEKKPLSKVQQRDNADALICLLDQAPWLKEEEEQREDYYEADQKYLDYLQQIGWAGYWLLALRPCSHERRIAKYWDSYVEALGKGRELAVDTLDWLNGRPFHRPVRNVFKAVEGTVDLLGYIHWHHVAID